MGAGKKTMFKGNLNVQLMNSVHSPFELYYKYQSLLMKLILLFVIGWHLNFIPFYIKVQT